MLAQVVDLAEGRDGALYVLDRDASKVVVFNSNGSVRRVIGYGKGQGPGELARPSSLAVSETGEVFVLDGGQSRVTVFDTTGKLLRTFLTPGGIDYQLRLSHGRIYVSQYIFKPGAPAVFVYDLIGNLIEKTFVPSEEDVSFGRTGNTYRMAVMRDGGIALAHPNPGTWSRAEAPGQVRGRPFVEGNIVTQSKPDAPFVARASLRGFGELSGGRVLFLFDKLKPSAINTPARPAFNIFLATTPNDGIKPDVFDAGEVGRNLLVSTDGNSFYLTVAEPYYQVVRFRLTGR